MLGKMRAFIDYGGMPWRILQPDYLFYAFYVAQFLYELFQARGVFDIHYQVAAE